MFRILRLSELAWKALLGILPLSCSANSVYRLILMLEAKKVGLNVKVQIMLSRIYVAMFLDSYYFSTLNIR